MTSTSTAALITALLSACGGTGATTTPDFAGQPGADLAGSAAGDLSTMSGEGLALGGTWAGKNVDSQIFSGVLGMDTVTITSLSRVQLVQNGTTLTSTTQVCAITLTPYKSSQTVYPAAAIAALGTSASAATLSANAIGATYTPSKQVQLSGWTATTNPETDALPTAASDARVMDTDSDGHPGVTLQITGFPAGNIYVAGRSTVDIAATVASNDRIAGSSTTHLSQNVLGSDNSLLAGSVITAAPNTAPGATHYQMIRLPAGTDTCAQIVAQAATLFP